MIRSAVAADAEAVVALWLRALSESAGPDRPRRETRSLIERKLDVDDGLLWGMVEGDQIGAAALAGLGHANAVVNYSERELSAWGCPNINLQVLGTNESGRRAPGYHTDAVVSLGRRL